MILAAGRNTPNFDVEATAMAAPYDQSPTVSSM
jgi:hypothetical protein